MNIYTPKINQQLDSTEIDTSTEFAFIEQSQKPIKSDVDRSLINHGMEPNDLAFALAESRISAIDVENNDTIPKKIDSTQQDDITAQNDGPLVYPIPNLEQLQKLTPKERFCEGRLIYIHSDVGLPPEIRVCLGQQLEIAGAVMTSNYDDTKGHDSVIYIFRHRDSELFMEKCNQGKTVASLAWLMNTLRRGRVESPLRSIWDFPTPKGGIPGMENNVATITGYEGEARSLIFQLCAMVGLKWTPNLGKDTTHVICSSKGTDKYRIGMQRNCTVVNHLWLEDCYQQWELKSLDDKRYSYFPGNNLLQKLIGNTPLKAKDLEKWYNKETWPGITAYTPAYLLRNIRRQMNELPDFDGSLLSKRPRQAAVDANSQLRDVVVPDMNIFQQQQRSKVSPSAIDTAPIQSVSPAPSSKKQQSNLSSSITDTSPIEPIPPVPAIEKRGTSLISAPSSMSRKRTKLGGNRNQVLPTTPATSSGKITQYLISNQDKTRLLPSKDQPLPRIPATDTNEGSKKIAISSYTLTKEEEKVIRILGGKVVHDIRNADALVVPDRILRTPKFLCANNLGVIITNLQWLKDSINNQAWQDPLDYPVNDEETEEKYDFKLYRSLPSTWSGDGKRKRKQGTWLQGYDVCVIQTCHDDALKDVVESAGGKFIQVPKRRLLLGSKENVTQDTPYNTVIALANKNAKQQGWTDLQKYGIGIYDKDLVVIGSLRQRLSLDEFRLA